MCLQLLQQAKWKERIPDRLLESWQEGGQVQTNIGDRISGQLQAGVQKVRLEKPVQQQTYLAISSVSQELRRSRL